MVGRAWLMLAKGDAREHGGNAGYDDDPGTHYSWDDTVAHHAEPMVGDVIALWDDDALLGVSVIERIDEANGTKLRYRCTRCGQTRFNERVRLLPRFHCRDCGAEFDDRAIETIPVHTYRTFHEPAWVELRGRISAQALRDLCLRPKSIQSLRELDWSRFRAVLGAEVVELGVVEQVRGGIAGGYRTIVTRARIGQGRFRTALVNRYGHTCAITGAQPASTLDAAHLYSYAEHGAHHQHGGFLLRKDVHRLFDLGLLCVHPERLEIDLHPEVRKFPAYAPLHQRPLGIDVPPATCEWLAAHWRAHRGAV